jgi:regulator of sirC expression with transglutaminase-like and TPR domain
MNEGDIRSLAQLLSDEDRKIVRIARDKLLTLSPEFLSFMRDVQTQSDPDVVDEITYILEELRVFKIEQDLRVWSNQTGPRHLEQGAVLLARFDSPQLEDAAITNQLDFFSERVLERCPSYPSPQVLLGSLCRYLFQEENFKGNQKNYYDPDNSYLHRVLERKVGIPISLSVLMLAVAERLKLPLRGVGMPGHFLVKFSGEEGSVFIDAFNQGKVLGRDDCKKWLLKSGFGFKEEYLSTVTDGEIMGRMIRNLVCIYAAKRENRKAEILSAYLRTISPF